MYTVWVAFLIVTVVLVCEFLTSLCMLLDSYTVDDVGLFINPSGIVPEHEIWT